MAKFFLDVELSCFKERILKPKCVVADVTWNNLAFAFSHANKQFVRNDFNLVDVAQFQNISRPDKAQFGLAIKIYFLDIYIE